MYDRMAIWLITMLNDHGTDGLRERLNRLWDQNPGCTWTEVLDKESRAFVKYVEKIKD